MQRTHATTGSETHRQPPDHLPKQRAAAAGRDRADQVRPVEEEVARLADFVLKAWSLADRYEERLRRVAPSTPSFTDRQARVETLRTAAERGRNRLVSLGREA
ncbi:MAG: hypothetical protein QOE05_1791 [Actinomycetota bacterium]|jgi:hypothetical protein|nr:hypothetical protein [Actinomycetota bacterium]